MGLHPVMGGLLQLRRGAAELHRGRGHGQRLVLRLGELVVGILVGLKRVEPGFLRIGEVGRWRLSVALRVLGLAIGGKGVLERGALLLELARGGLQRVGGGAGGGGGGIELGAGAAKLRIVKGGIDIEQRIAGLHLLVGVHIDMDHGPGNLRRNAHDIGADVCVLGGGVELAIAPIGEGATDGRGDHGEKRDPADGGEGAGGARGCVGRSVLVHVCPTSVAAWGRRDAGHRRSYSEEFKVKHGRMMTRLNLLGRCPQDIRCVD